jgi:hypothetical protein
VLKLASAFGISPVNSAGAQARPVHSTPLRVILKEAFFAD